MAANPTDVTIAILSRLAGELGMTLSTRCAECGAVISGNKSLHTRLGRVCRKRAAEAAAQKEKNRPQQA